MSAYAPVARADNIDIEDLELVEADKLIEEQDRDAAASRNKRRAAPASAFGVPQTPLWEKARQRLLIRQPNPRVVLVIAAGVVFVFVLYAFDIPSIRASPKSTGGKSIIDVHQLSASWKQRPHLPFIQLDGEHLLPADNATAAVWPDGYPEAAKIAFDNGVVVPDTLDPWPDKPHIASIWLAPERFPDGLGGQPHDPTRLPDMGKENGHKPSPGLHDPPLPSFPANEGQFERILIIPRQYHFQAPGWTPPKDGMGQPKSLPPVQKADFAISDQQKRLNRDRRDWVKRAFLHAWEGYKAHAFGHDEITPISRGIRDSYNAWGASTVDNLDTLLMMGLNHEYNLARTHIRALDFSMVSKPGTCNATDGPDIHLFETTIRYLGGLLSAYDLSGDQLMIARAKELADWLLPAFGTSSGIPIAFYKLGWNPAGEKSGQNLAAEVASLCMEFTRLSQITGDPAYFNVVQRITDRLKGFKKTLYGTLVPVVIDANGPAYGDFTIGGMVDSYYEYLIKMVALLGNNRGDYAEMFTHAANDMYRWLVVNVTVMPNRPGTIIIGSRELRGPLKAEQQHLSTFAGGMFGLAGKLLQDPHMASVGVELTDSAVWAYHNTLIGLMPEIVTFHHPYSPERWEYAKTDDGLFARQRGSPLGSSTQGDRQYKGRPESIESVFYMYRITGDPAWQKEGWRMFVAWMRHAITPVGFANIADVNVLPVQLIDSQESFVLAETLKYYYLLFSEPELINLDDYVFNTEAHPLLRPGKQRKSMWSGPEVAVDQAYADPRDRHLFREGASQGDIPTGRGTAKQQTWRSQHCRPTQ